MLLLNPQQRAIVEAESTTFVTGPPGAGKTTVLQNRLIFLLQAGEPAYTILALVARREHRRAYQHRLQTAGLPSYADLKITTYTGLALEMVRLFWPLVARDAGFRSAFRPPTFLTYDLAQLAMWRLATPLLESGVFDNLHLRPQRIVSQLLDILNRAALNNLDLVAATQRQMNSWAIHNEEQLRHLEQAHQAASTFRAQCLERNTLDLSLTIDTFHHHVLAHPEFARYFQERFRHLLVDNLEEQTPAGQAFVERLLNRTASASLIYDEEAGYRRFLSADPLGAARFARLTRQAFRLEESFTTSPGLRTLSHTLSAVVQGAPVGQDMQQRLQLIQQANAVIRERIVGRYRRETVFQLAHRLAHLIHAEQIPARDIAVVVPYLDGALSYTLLRACKQLGVPTNLARRRATPREEPRVRAWLTWAALAHPEWNTTPKEYDVAEALTLSIHGCDPARAALLAGRLYDEPLGRLQPVAQLPTRYRERIGDNLVERYEQLRLWLEAQSGQHRLDHFLYRLFADLLSLPDFQPEPDVAGAAVCSWLVMLATRLCDAAPALQLTTGADIGAAFFNSIEQGLVGSEPPDTGDPPDPNGVLITTIYGFLLQGQAVRWQVWLETAASGWLDIPRQPLSNVFVLAPGWPAHQAWTSIEEYEIRQQLLARILMGLCHRCQDGVILATSELDAAGQRQDSALWRALETMRELAERAGRPATPPPPETNEQLEF